MGVPYTFATATTSIPLSQLDANFNTPVTIGTSTVGLGNTITSISNLTLTNVTIVSGTSNATQNLANVTGTLASANGGTGQSNITFPSSGGTAMISGNMPAFSAYMSSGQALSSVTSTLMPFNTKTFDTAGCFNNTGSTVTLNGISVPAYSFAPNVAGYYQVSAEWAAAGPSTPGDYSITIFKSGFGNTYALSSGGQATSSTYTVRPSVSGLLYLNGTSDYVTVYAYVGTGQTTQSGASSTFFTACLIRSA